MNSQRQRKKTEEEWRETPEPGYFVSNFGEVWSTRSKRKIKPYMSRRGQHQVDLCGRKWTLSHLVYVSFHGKKPYRLVYLDGDSKNPCLDNLERDEDFVRNFEPEEKEE